MDLDEASREVVAVLVRLADRIAVHLPLHATAIKGELFGVKMTLERWHRLAAVLASFSAVPGATLSRDEHVAKAIPLRFVTVAQMMAQAKLGRGDVEDRLTSAVEMARDIEREAIAPPGGEQP